MSSYVQSDFSHLSTGEAWRARAKELDALISTEEPAVTALANGAAYLWAHLDEINWCGFYLYDGDKLVLGPFIGKPACTLIAMGKGVCGSSAAKRETIVVEDVHLFPGHIACDDASQSEIVIPLLAGDKLLGVLDIDAPVKARFDQATAASLEVIAALIASKLATIKANTSLFKL